MELISEQFNVHAFQSSPCLGPMFTTYRELSGNTHTEPKIKAENGVMYLPKLETHKVMDKARWQGARYHSMKGKALSASKSGGLIE